MQYQTEPNVRTVENCLIEAFKKRGFIDQSDTFESLHWSRAARTDSGVSCSGNVVSFFLKEAPENPNSILSRVNSELPDNIFLLSQTKVKDDFIAYRSCRSRTYRYYFFENHLDVEKMKEAAKLFQGRKDFRNFCKMKDFYVKHGTSRIMFDCHIGQVHTYKENSSFSKSGLNMYYLECRASGFLWHQVES